MGPRDHVICALSGGVDSTVAATLVHQVLGGRLHCVFVDNGLLRYKARPSAALLLASTVMHPPLIRLQRDLASPPCILQGHLCACRCDVRGCSRDRAGCVRLLCLQQEAERVMDTFRNHLHLPVTKIDDSARMLARLKVCLVHMLIDGSFPPLASRLLHASCCVHCGRKH